MVSYSAILHVLGESGLGKTTFMNTLFNTPLLEHIVHKNPKATKTVHVEKKIFCKSADWPKRSIQCAVLISPLSAITENGFSLNLTVIDTPGFGDVVDRRAE